MSMVFFVDESGHDRRHAEAYEVVGGVAVPQRELWAFICGLRELVFEHFGRRAAAKDEIKGTNLLRRKNLAQAYGDPIPPKERRQLIDEFLEINDWNKAHAADPTSKRSPRRRHFDAYAQSRRLFCRDVLTLCRRHSARILAAIIAPEASRLIEEQLRSDYAGIFYKLYECSAEDSAQRSLIIHDERDDSQCLRLAQQLYVYYVNEGRHVAERVIPEPMFVKSHLTLGVLAADIVAYILSWGFRHAEVLGQPARPDLKEFADLICEINGIPYGSSNDMPEDLEAFGIPYISDLSDLAHWSGSISAKAS